MYGGGEDEKKEQEEDTKEEDKQKTQFLLPPKTQSIGQKIKNLFFRQKDPALQPKADDPANQTKMRQTRQALSEKPRAGSPMRKTGRGSTFRVDGNELDQRQLSN